MRLGVEGLGATVGTIDGAGRFLTGLLKALARRADVDVTAFVGPSMREAVEELEGLERAEVVNTRGRGDRLLAQHVSVPRAAARADLGAVLYLGNYAPVLSGPPPVVIVTNLLVAIDEPAYGRSRALYRRFARSQIAKRAAAVVAISHALADALESSAPALRGRIHVVPPPFDAAEVNAARASVVADAPEQYFVAVGRPWPYRNYELALEALAASKLPHSLVILGEAPDEERLPLEKRASELGIRDRVRFTGFVTDVGALRGWYEGASALVATSKLESFGQSLGEAMAVGTPVVAVRRTAFPEVVGDAGLLVEPTVEGVADGLQTVVRPEERDRLSARGRERAARTTWDRTAEQVVEICRDVVGRQERVRTGGNVSSARLRGPSGRRS